MTCVWVPVVDPAFVLLNRLINRMVELLSMVQLAGVWAPVVPMFGLTMVAGVWVPVVPMFGLTMVELAFVWVL